MTMNYIQKIDPAVRNAVKISSEEPYRVILYAKKYKKCLPAIKAMGVKVNAEIPLINGYVVEFPTNLLAKLARCRSVRYIAADMDIKAQECIAV
jgi:hypothetical protein